MAVGVRLHGLALARAAAMSAIPTATATANTVSATPLAAWEDFPSAVEMAPKAAATHRPAASSTCAAAATRSPARGAVGLAAISHTRPRELGPYRLPSLGIELRRRL